MSGEKKVRKVEKFEDLIVWQKARELARCIYRITDEGRLARDFSLKDQMRRAAVSILSNIAEGFERGSKAEFHHLLLIAKGSCAELRAQLYIALHAGYLGSDDFEKLQAMAEEVGRMLGGLRLAVNRKRNST